MPKKTILPTRQILGVLFIALLFSCHQDHYRQITTGLEGKSIPAFDILLPDSITHVSIDKVRSNQPVVLFYFDPGCQYCQAEMRDITDNIRSLQHIQFYIFSSQPFGEMIQFYKTFQLNKYQNLCVGMDYKEAFKELFSPEGVPYTAIYSRDKKLTKAFLGGIGSQQIKDAVRD